MLFGLINMKEKSKKFWKFIDGKKTYIGVGLHVFWFVSNLVFPDFANNSEQNIGHGIIFQITGVGIGHKIDKFLKSTTGKKAIQIITGLFKKK